jgi:hypothetical protein
MWFSPDGCVEICFGYRPGIFNLLHQPAAPDAPDRGMLHRKKEHDDRICGYFTANYRNEGNMWRQYNKRK